MGRKCSPLPPSSAPSPALSQPFIPAGFLLNPHPAHTLILERAGANEAAVPFRIATHHSVGGPGLELNLLLLQSLHAELAPPTQVLASPPSQVHGLEGAEGWGGGLMIPCWNEGDCLGFLREGLLLVLPPPAKPRLRVSLRHLWPGGGGTQL